MNYQQFVTIRTLTLAEMLAEVRNLAETSSLTYYCETPQTVSFLASLPVQFAETGRVFDEEVEYRWSGQQSICIALTETASEFRVAPPHEAMVWGAQDRRVRLSGVTLPKKLFIQPVIKNHITVFTRFVSVEWEKE
ncbi:MAG: hypothetical protein K1Y36_28195 [Blastocatellia bacterium]|nr:hypothetical protein [Blastocatellia bacterium]